MNPDKNRYRFEQCPSKRKPGSPNRGFVRAKNMLQRLMPQISKLTHASKAAQ